MSTVWSGVGLALLGSPAQAQEQPPTPAAAAARISVISAEEIQAFGYQSLWEAVGTVRGVVPSDDLTHRSLALRSLSLSGDNPSRMGLTLDGHPYKDDFLGAFSSDEGLMVDLQGVSQIVVVRGPGSAYQGTGALSGILQVETGDRAARPRDGVAVAAVRDGYARARVAAGGGDAHRGAWASAAGALSQGQGYVFPELDDGTTGGKVLDNDQLQAATLMARAWAGRLELQAHTSLRDKQIPTAPEGSLLDDDRAHHQEVRAFVEARLAPTPERVLDLSGRLSLDQASRQEILPYAQDVGGIAETSWHGLWLSAAPRLRWTPTPRARLTLGAQAQVHLQGERVSAATTETLTPRVFSGDAAVDVAVTRWLTLLAAGRLDQLSTVGLQVSPQGAVVIQPGPRDTLTLQAGRASRAPSIDELTDHDGGSSREQAVGLEAEALLAAEAIYTHRLGTQTTTTVDVFAHRLEGLIDTYLSAQGVPVYANTSEAAHVAGAEAEILRDWHQGWMASASYALQRAREGTLQGDHIPPNIPTHRAILKAASPPGPGPGGVQLATLLRAESGRLTLLDTWTDPALLWDLTANGQIPGSDAVRWSFGVRNALDWRATLPASSTQLPLPALPLPGRSLFVEIRHER